MVRMEPHTYARTYSLKLGTANFTVTISVTITVTITVTNKNSPVQTPMRVSPIFKSHKHSGDPAGLVECVGHGSHLFMFLVLYVLTAQSSETEGFVQLFLMSYELELCDKVNCYYIHRILQLLRM